LNTSCLERAFYFDEFSAMVRTHCFKWKVSEDHVVVGGLRYIRVNSSDLSWEEAERFCETRAAHLVSITSRHEERIVKSLLDDGHSIMPTAIYIGIHAPHRTNKVSTTKP
jgi:hypothetical protein